MCKSCNAQKYPTGNLKAEGLSLWDASLRLLHEVAYGSVNFNLDLNQADYSITRGRLL
jgi:hypothetical protein